MGVTNASNIETYLEAELDYNEKISVIFLLCESPVIALKLSDTSLPIHGLIEVLSEASSKDSDVSDKLIGALALIQNFQLLNFFKIERSNLNKFKKEVIFSRKLLWCVIENLVESEIKELIRRVEKDWICPHMEQIELKLLYWMKEGYDLIKLCDHLREMDKLEESHHLESMLISKQNICVPDSPSKLVKPSLDNCKTSQSISGCMLNSYYDVDPGQMGYCVIFNQQNFCSELNLTDRNGSFFDAEKLKWVFSSFGFDVCLYQNETCEKVIKYLTAILDKVSVSHSSFVLIFLSHGTEGFLYCTDDKVKTTKLENFMFKCKNLIGKPKIFIEQSCRSSVPAQNHNIDTDGPSLAKFNQVSQYADFLKFNSTVKNLQSYRNIEKGSIFIQSLCNELLSHGTQKSFQRICLAVNSIIAEMPLNTEEGVLRTIPEVRHTFRKKLYLKHHPQNYKISYTHLIELQLFRSYILEYCRFCDVRNLKGRPEEMRALLDKFFKCQRKQAALESDDDHITKETHDWHWRNIVWKLFGKILSVLSKVFIYRRFSWRKPAEC